MGRRDEVRENRAGGYIETISPLGYDILINGTNKYLNFNTVSGSLGYGFRDNSGIMEFKSSGGAWAAIGSSTPSGVLLLDQTTPQTIINGVPRFNLGILGGTTSNKTDFPLANSVFSTGDTGHTYAHPIGLVGEAVSGSDAGNTATGIGGVASTNGPGTARGVVGVGKVTASADTGASVGVRGRAIDTHAGDSNIGVYSTAQNGLTNYSFYGAAGDIYNVNGNISGLGLFSYKPDIKDVDGINGVSLINDTASDVVNTVQKSPGLYFKGSQRDTDDAENKTSEWRIEVVPISATSTSSTMRFRSSQNGSTYISAFGILSGGNISCTGALTTTTGVNSPITNMTTTSAVGFYTYSNSAATAAIPVRYSPAIYVAGRAWNTTPTAASNILQYRQEVRPVSGATTSASYYWSFDNNGGGYIDIMNLSSTGVLTTLSNISTPRAFTVLNGIITNSSDAGLNMVCNANASTTYPVRYSPALYMTAKAWNTTATAASNSINFKQEIRPISGTTTSGTYYWSFDNNGGGYTDIMSLSSAGILSVGTVATPTIKTDTTTPTDLTVVTGAAKTMLLDTSVYEDIVIQAYNLRGGSSAPDYVAFQDSIYAAAFRNASTDIVYGSFEIPHGYKEGTDLEIHLHWSPSSTNTGNCVFNYAYSIANMTTGTFGTETVITLTQAGSGTVNKHQYVSGSAVISGTNLKIGAVLVFALSRPTGDAFTGDAFVHSVGCHYQKDTLGSRQQGVK